MLDDTEVDAQAGFNQVCEEIEDKLNESNDTDTIQIVHQQLQQGIPPCFLAAAKWKKTTEGSKSLFSANLHENFDRVVAGNEAIAEYVQTNEFINATTTMEMRYFVAH